MKLIAISKKIVLLIVLIASISGCKEDDEELFTEVKSFNGDVIIITQGELDTFATAKYEEINGSLTLSNNVTSLNGLLDLNRILGDLDIIDTQLTTLEGLDNLNQVSGSITITSTQQPLQSITDFCALQTLFSSGEFNTVNITNNEFNPTSQDIAQGNCTQ